MILLATWAIAVTVASWGATGAMTRWLRRRTILDHPVERSLHSRPVPKGAGASVVAIVLISWLALALVGSAPAATPTICVLTFALAALSWFNDLRDLPPPLRLAVHFMIVGIAVTLLPARGQIFGGLIPPALDTVLTAVVWTWFINLYNFMDGIDGITAVETCAISLGLAAVAALMGTTAGGAVALPVMLVAAILGFLPWNWHPARVFLGDVGSVPIGFLVGWLLLLLAGDNHRAAALLLPLYYIADATITLARRLISGETIWRAHRSHFYQRAVGADQDHAAVVAWIAAGDFALIGAALISLFEPLPALIAGAALVAVLLLLLERRGRNRV